MANLYLAGQVAITPGEMTKVRINQAIPCLPLVRFPGDVGKDNIFKY